jgi:hypothetical protein
LSSSSPIRLDAATGVLAAALFLIGFALPGTPPRPDESTATIAAYLGEHRSAILAGDVLIALASAVFLWFLGNLRGYLRAAGEDHLSSAAALGGSVGTGLAVGTAAAAVSGARTGALPAWAVWTGLGTAVLQVVTLAGLVAEGAFFAAGGPMALIAFVAISAWFIAVSLLMVRRF